MEEIVAGIRIGFDVIQKNPRRFSQFRKDWWCSQWLSTSIALGPCLRHQRCRHSTVLLTKSLELQRQSLYLWAEKTL